MLFILMSGNMMAQGISEPEIQLINGRKYYIHTVEKGNTLYSIAKQYDTPLEVIMQENPHLQQGSLSKGDKIKIPLKQHTDVSAHKNGNFIYHAVKPGETLYAIAREYGISVNDLKANNPEAGDELSLGQELKIPVALLKKNPVIEKQAEKSNKLHTVAKGETLYSLSKLYGVSVEAIQEINNGLPSGLREGDQIQIPLDLLKATHGKELTVAETSTFLKQGSPKSEYRVALVLPFFLYQNAELEQQQEGKPVSEQFIFPRSKVAFEFYQGILLALDSIEKQYRQGKIKLHVYDSGRDTNNVSDLLSKPEMKKMDLIIGPLYYSTFVKMAEFAKQHGIMIVSPVAIQNKVLLSNPYVVKTQPSKTVQLTRFAEYVADSFRTDNIIIIKTSDPDAASAAETFAAAYKNYRRINADTLASSHPKMITWGSGAAANLSSVLSKEKRNFIFVPTASQVFATELVNYLSGIHESFPIVLGGLDNWLKYENIDLAYFNRFNLHVVTDGYVDLNKENAASLYTDYVSKYSVYPGKFAFSGFECGYYFFNLLHNTNGEIKNNITKAKAISNPFINFNFISTGPESGYENAAASILYMHDYRFYKSSK